MVDFFIMQLTSPEDFRLTVERSHSWDRLKPYLSLGLLSRRQMTPFGASFSLFLAVINLFYLLLMFSGMQNFHYIFM